MWFCEHKPKSAEELADHYLATNKKANSQSDGTSSENSGSSTGKPGPKGVSEKASYGKQSGDKPLDARRCYNCNEYVHVFTLLSFVPYQEEFSFI